jgi:hypoxanthine phosphoribosyltransferase
MDEKYITEKNKNIGWKRACMNRDVIKEDFDIISWERLSKYIDLITKQIIDYTISNNINIKYVVPIMRSGLIPAVMLSEKLNITDMLPIQIKYNYEKKSLDKKIDFSKYENTSLKQNEYILLVEDKHVTGRTANLAVDMILDVLPNAKIIYVTISRDYYYKDCIDNILLNLSGFYTNESMNLTCNECIDLKIDPIKLITLLPWEDIEEKISKLNS